MLEVIYLHRTSNRPVWLRRFLESIHLNPSGTDFNLRIIVKGEPFDFDELKKLSQSSGATEVSFTFISDDFGPLDAFLQAATETSAEILLFLTSYSYFSAPGWGKFLFDALKKKGFHLIGATGSNETAFHGQSFPNPNLRTNAFCIHRVDFLSLDFTCLREGNGGHVFEAGENSMTSQTLNRGLRVAVVDCNGHCFEPHEWIRSSTFRLGNQSGLLIRDNRTDQYDLAYNSGRVRLSKLAWGTGQLCSSTSFFKTSLKRISWKFRMFGALSILSKVKDARTVLRS